MPDTQRIKRKQPEIITISSCSCGGEKGIRITLNAGNWQKRAEKSGKRKTAFRNWQKLTGTNRNARSGKCSGKNQAQFSQHEASCFHKETAAESWTMPTEGIALSLRRRSAGSQRGELFSSNMRNSRRAILPGLPHSRKEGSEATR